MSNIPRPAFQPDEWVEEKVTHARQKARECQAGLESSITRHPLESVALAFGAGYLARSLPLAGTVSATLRAGLTFLPHVLLGLGAARAWQFLADSRARTAPPPRAAAPLGKEPEPVIAGFP